jgi:hypothetical protein
MHRLSLEKEFEHELFVRQIQDMSLDTMKKLLADLHILYLGQQSIISDMLKQPVKLER